MNRILYLLFFVWLWQVQCEYGGKLDLSNEVNKKLADFHIRAKRSAVDQVNGEESATFHPDTILIDPANVVKERNSARTLDKSLISFEEAMRKKNQEPVKPFNYEFNIPDPPANVIPLLEKAADGEYNYETRKLFERPANFGSPIEVNKTVKKDLSSIKI